MKAFIDYKTYYSPTLGNYIDLQFQYVAYTISFVGEPSGGLQAKIGVSLAVTSNATSDTISFQQFALESPVMRDSIVEDFYDLIRLQLQPGNYTAFITLADLNSKEKPIEGRLDIVVGDKTAAPHFSDILIAESATPSNNESPFQKSGFEIIPRLSNFFDPYAQKIPFYVEVYNSNLIPDSSFGIRQQIINATTNTPVQGFSRFVRINQEPVIPILRTVDITKLNSGSYTLKLQLINKNGEDICAPILYPFERVNNNEEELSVENIILDPNFQQSITDDSLKYYLASLIPIARPAEVKSILKTLKANSPDLCRKHIQQFWVQTAGASAYDSWLIYKKTVLLVEDNYGNNFQEGFETDRGRVYLQYGPPNTITVKNMNPAEYPYEIWHYYKIKTFSNKRFVFYNPDLVNEGYRLLHSDMVGEQQNYKWQQMLSRRANSAVDVDGTQGADHYGGNSEYYYKQH